MPDLNNVYVPPIWVSARQIEAYRLGYAQALAGECDAFLWIKLRGRVRLAYEAGREHGAAIREGRPVPVSQPHQIQPPARITTRPTLQERLDALDAQTP